MNTIPKAAYTAAIIGGVIVPFPRTAGHAIQVIDACNIEIQLLTGQPDSELPIAAYRDTISVLKAYFFDEEQ